MILKNEMVRYQDNLFIVISKFIEPDTETLDKIKQNYIFDIVLRKDNYIYLCQKIDDAEVLVTYITDEKIINSVVVEFLKNKENKNLEEIDNYISEINSNEELQYSSKLVKEYLEKNIPEKENA